MKNFGTIQTDVINRMKIDSSDTTSINLILSDANDAIGIIAAQRNWDELYASGTVSLTAADGDTLYSLASNVDKIETMGISFPVNYGKSLTYVMRKNLLNLTLQKTINGKTTPQAWYFGIPSISSDNVETKRISFDVMPEQNYTILYTYRSYPPQLATNSNFPFFDPNYHYIIDYYCEWKYCERNPDPSLDPAYFRGEWENGVSELLGRYDSKVIDNPPIAGPNINAIY